ncbi:MULTISPECIES: carbohydrate ABC transporter permease [Alteribacter]|uniref:Carbohydrate ABC transporter permease n=1 Tax=Alteribacter keqinensis TaxID=2483800 RepID=A0A3M7TSB4_9BACI|nr:MULTISPECIES: carbohydrate ABC transporter permease [Alteribacter]MBM7097543.1 carbohydrate ABC transporter permease [Alteribacter salitolerans]RNA68496.1 carbohydrate ABC transporter permease [Alteribacter keqinensis]
MKSQMNIAKLLLYAILTSYAIVTLIPFIWALSASFKPLNEILAGGLNFIPQEFTFNNYITIFTEQALFPRWLFNSVFVAVIGTALNLVFNSMAGYALARLTFPGKKTLFITILAVLMIPAQVTMIPNFLILKELGWLNSYQGLIIPGMVNATFIFMMRQFFVNFPREVEEAAAIDGLGRFGTFFRIVMPMAKPALAAQAIFVFMSFWNNFMAPLIIMTDASMYTLPVGLNAFQSDYATYWNYIMAASMVFTLPVLVIYIFFNRFFLRGLSFRGDK